MTWRRFVPRLWTRAGITRRVIITARYAVKFPRLKYGVQGFMRGCLANMSEQTWSNYQGVPAGAACPNPVIAHGPFGLVNVYRRALPYDGPVESSMFGFFGDQKGSNLGVVDGEVVIIDFDMACNCWLQCKIHGPDATHAPLRGFGDENDHAEIEYETVSWTTGDIEPDPGPPTETPKYLFGGLAP